MSWSSALHTLSGHRDLRVGFFGKPHADTHEENHLARGHPVGPLIALKRTWGLSSLEVNPTLSAYAQGQPLGLPTAQPPPELVARWVHREFQKVVDRISRLRLENLISPQPSSQGSPRRSINQREDMIVFYSSARLGWLETQAHPCLGSCLLRGIKVTGRVLTLCGPASPDSGTALLQQRCPLGILGVIERCMQIDRDSSCAQELEEGPGAQRNI